MVSGIREIGWSSNSTLVRVFWIVFPATAILSVIVSPYMALASLAYFLMIAGLAHRKERVVHVRLMSAAIALDLILVLVLEIQRSAVETAVGMPLGIPQKIHILFSLSAVLTYGPVVYLGWRRYRGKASKVQKSRHLRLGVLAFVFRTVGYVFMFSMIK